jgi:hypothetical protein
MPVIALLFTVRDFMQGYNGTGYRAIGIFYLFTLRKRTCLFAGTTAGITASKKWF